MNKYINADQFERDCMFDRECEDMQDVIYKLRDYPSADVVEVVRCKDCSHHIAPYCVRFITSMIPVSENDYCSKGKWKNERKK